MADIEIIDDEENDEITHPWEVTQSELPKEQKKALYRELFIYGQSDEYKELEKFCNEKVIIQETISRGIAFNREETKNTKSIIDEYVSLYTIFKEISSKITNITFKEYFTEYRMTALESAIVRKKGIVDRNGTTVPLDMPIYTELDISKEITAGYNSFSQYLKYCLSLYETKEEKEELIDNPHQPY